jgi:hypothetical protein
MKLYRVTRAAGFAAPLKFPVFRANVTVLTAISGTPLSG